MNSKENQQALVITRTFEYGWTVLGPMSDNAVAGMNQSLDKLVQAIA
ncbi:hypothetical protein [Paenibacillus residui]|uniref:Uncharacterized protein n=1 Tax=Paenibacillus residui TaxID=629724 RepID=A0ABW3DI59_9BACL|nr:hypothetical protein [Aneurinibacillus sp. XH2]